MDGDKKAGEGMSSESGASSVGKLIDAVVDTGAELAQGKLKKAAKRKLPATITAKKSSKKAKKSSATRAKKASTKKSKGKSARRSKKTKATKRK